MLKFPNNFKKSHKTLTLCLLLATLSSARAQTKDLVCEIVESYHYPCEQHTVQTADGYQLSLHRIPAASGHNRTARHPFLLMHGLIGSAADFILAGRQRALGLLLHDYGYDVWLPNARGTTHSKRHSRFDSSMRDFWDFSWHDIGTRDLPAILDYMQRHTGHRQLHYVAHSQGSSVLLVLLAEHPEYNERILSASLLAPVAFLSNIRSPPLNAVRSSVNKIEGALRRLGVEEILPSTAFNQLGGHLLCDPGVLTHSLCLMLTFMVVGFSDYPMDRHLLPRIFETTPAGISRKQLVHYAQLIQSGNFQKFDYQSPELNYRHYNRTTPPRYNLRNVRINVKLFYGARDYILDPKDVLLLARRLPNAPYTLHELRGFNHIDLLYSTEAPRLIYKRIIGDTQKMYKR